MIMRIGIAADHGGFELKKRLLKELAQDTWEWTDFGAFQLDPQDDYPDWVVPLARAVARGEVQRGVAVCGSGVGAGIAANKIRNVRAALVMDSYSARQGVEDDDMNLLCLGGRVLGYELAAELVRTYLSAVYKDAERFRRRLQKVAALETGP
jgi:ribose 5-phosphate isomerase B